MISFKASELFDMSDWYEDTYNWSFFGDDDYCLIVPRLNVIKFLHDEPLVVTYQVL